MDLDNEDEAYEQALAESQQAYTQAIAESDQEQQPGARHSQNPLSQLAVSTGSFLGLPHATAHAGHTQDRGYEEFVDGEEGRSHSHNPLNALAHAASSIGSHLHPQRNSYSGTGTNSPRRGNSSEPASMSDTSEEQIVRRYAFCTHGQHREVSLMRKGASFIVHLDEQAAGEIAGIEYHNLHLPFTIPVQDKEPLEASVSHYILTVNNFPVEPWWTLEHGDNLDRPPPEVADANHPFAEITDIHENNEPATPRTPRMLSPHARADGIAPEDIAGIPEFIHPRPQRAQPSSWWACCGAPPLASPRPRSAATKIRVPHDPHEHLSLVCCRSEFEMDKEDRPVERVCSTVCTYWGKEIFG